MPGFNNSINVCNGFVTSIYLYYITVYITLWNKEYPAKKIYTCILYTNDEAEIVNKDDKNNIDDKESGGSGDDDDD